MFHVEHWQGLNIMRKSNSWNFRANKWKDKTRLEICALFQELYVVDPQKAISNDFLDSLAETANNMQNFAHRTCFKNVRMMLIQQGVYPTTQYDTNGNRIAIETGTQAGKEKAASILSELGAEKDSFLAKALKSHFNIKTVPLKKQSNTVTVTEKKLEFLNALPEGLGNTLNRNLSASSILELKAELSL